MKGDGITDKAKPTKAGLDVNDVSILFPKVGNGQFYPNIPVWTVWQKTAFQDMIQFAAGSPVGGASIGQFIVPKEYLTPSKLTGEKKKVAQQIAAVLKLPGASCKPYEGGDQLCYDPKAKITFSNHRANVADINRWRIVSMRMDLCAGAHNDVEEQCDVEFRLIGSLSVTLRRSRP